MKAVRAFGIVGFCTLAIHADTQPMPPSRSCALARRAATDARRWSSTRNIFMLHIQRIGFVVIALALVCISWAITIRAWPREGDAASRSNGAVPAPPGAKSHCRQQVEQP